MYFNQSRHGVRLGITAVCLGYPLVLIGGNTSESRSGLLDAVSPNGDDPKVETWGARVS